MKKFLKFFIKSIFSLVLFKVLMPYRHYAVAVMSTVWENREILFHKALNMSLVVVSIGITIGTGYLIFCFLHYGEEETTRRLEDGEDKILIVVTKLFKLLGGNKMWS